MIDSFSNFKRLFTFGCSYTQHVYPTWANVLSQEIPTCNFYNLGRSGAGNSYIAWKIAEANNRYKFDKNDLVVVMYTTFCREDRYIDGNWQLFGNVFHNHYYDKGFKKYADPTGYAIQNVATLDLSMQYLKSLPCTSVLLSGFPFDNVETSYDIYDGKVVDNLKKIYPHVFNLPISYMQFLHPNFSESANFADKGFKYKLDDGNWFGDAHPSPYWAYEYLKHLNFPLTSLAKDYALEQHEICKQFETFKQFMNYYENLHSRTADMIKDMF
jgi:hypothetical protein